MHVKLLRLEFRDALFWGRLYVSMILVQCQNFPWIILTFIENVVYYLKIIVGALSME